MNNVMSLENQAATLGGGAQGASGSLGQGNGPSLDDIAKAIEAAKAKNAEATARASSHQGMVKNIGDVPRPKQHSPMSALATGIRAYAMKKHMKKGQKAASEASQAEAAGEAATLAYEKQETAEILAEKRQYEEAQAIKEAEADEVSARKAEIRANIENDRRKKRDSGYSDSDTLTERYYDELVNLYGDTPEGRMKAHQTIEDNAASKARSAGGHPDATVNAVIAKEQAQIKDTQRADNTMKHILQKYEREGGEEFFGFEADLKSTAGGIADYFRMDAGGLKEFNARKRAFDSDLYSYANALLKARSGAAVTKQEFDRFKKEFPIRKGMGPVEFEKVLRNYAKGIERDLAFRMSQGNYVREGDMIVRKEGAAPDMSMMNDLADKRMAAQQKMWELDDESNQPGFDNQSVRAAEMAAEYREAQREIE